MASTTTTGTSAVTINEKITKFDKTNKYIKTFDDFLGEHYETVNDHDEVEMVMNKKLIEELNIITKSKNDEKTIKSLIHLYMYALYISITYELTIYILYEQSLVIFSGNIVEIYARTSLLNYIIENVSGMPIFEIKKNTIEYYNNQNSFKRYDIHDIDINDLKNSTNLLCEQYIVNLSDLLDNVNVSKNIYSIKNKLIQMVCILKMFSKLYDYIDNKNVLVTNFIEKFINNEIDFYNISIITYRMDLKIIKYINKDIDEAVNVIKSKKLSYYTNKYCEVCTINEYSNNICILNGKIKELDTTRMEEIQKIIDEHTNENSIISFDTSKEELERNKEKTICNVKKSVAKSVNNNKLKDNIKELLGKTIDKIDEIDDIDADKEIDEEIDEIETTVTKFKFIDKSTAKGPKKLSFSI